MPNDKYKKLLGLLPDDLKKGLLPAEDGLLKRVVDGKPLDLKSGDDEEDDPKNADNWDESRSIRAEFLRWLCIDNEAAPFIHARGFEIHGARFKDSLNFECTTIPHRLGLFKCAMPKIILRDAITKSINFSKSHTGPITADRLNVIGSFFLRSCFVAKGEVRLPGATIKGDLVCGNATFINKNNDALTADGITIEGSILLNDGFSAEGTVRFVGAFIKSDIDCSSGNFFNKNKLALCMERANIGGNLYLNTLLSSSIFHSRGQVSLLGIKIGGDLNCTGAIFEEIDGTALNARRMEVAGAFLWHTKERPKGEIDLRNAKVGQLEDNIKSWPEQGMLHINGFEYSTLSDDDTPMKPEDRFKWINLQHPEEEDRTYIPQPYEQLAKVLRDMGHENDAKQVYIAKQEELRKYGDIRWWQKGWYWFLNDTIRYGWVASRVIFWIILPIIIIGCSVFSLAHHFDLIVESKATFFADPIHEYPKFNAIIYSLDTFVPFLNLHQEDYFSIHPHKPWEIIFKLYLWAHIIAGWVFSTLAAVALSGLKRKE